MKPLPPTSSAGLRTTQCTRVLCRSYGPARNNGPANRSHRFQAAVALSAVFGVHPTPPLAGECKLLNREHKVLHSELRIIRAGPACPAGSTPRDISRTADVGPAWFQTDKA